MPRSNFIVRQFRHEHELTVAAEEGITTPGILTIRGNRIQLADVTKNAGPLNEGEH